MKRLVLFPLVLFFSLPFIGAANLFAEESTVNKIKDSAGDLETSTKKALRNTKQKIRKATGNDTALKDVKDSLHNIEDDASNISAKSKRKREH